MRESLPKVLVISNECFSRSTSNGRTLGGFFAGWQKDRLAQFFLHGVPDDSYCVNFFCVSDGQALKAWKPGKCKSGIVRKTESVPSTVEKKTKKIRRNAFSMLVRDFIWSTDAWKKSGFDEWVRNFSPEIVLLQVGDFPYLFRLAEKVAKQTHAGLVIYSSEDYYYKKYDYFRAKGITHFLYPIFYRRLKNSVEKCYRSASCAIYICEELRKCYEEDFNCRSVTLYTSTDVKEIDVTDVHPEFITTYCGNLGLKRHESLISVAECLQKISPDLYLDVYGKAPDEEIEKLLNTCGGIRYHGLVSYDTVRSVIANSDLLIHTESFDPFYQKDVKHGFSTKIADSLASGKPFLVYAPSGCACFRYLEENQAAFTASEPSQLESVLSEIVNDPQVRGRYRENALRIVEENHRSEKNTAEFRKILKEVCEEKAK